MYMSLGNRFLKTNRNSLPYPKQDVWALAHWPSVILLMQVHKQSNILHMRCMIKTPGFFLIFCV